MFVPPSQKNRRRKTGPGAKGSKKFGTSQLRASGSQPLSDSVFGAGVPSRSAPEVPGAAVDFGFSSPACIPSDVRKGSFTPPSQTQRAGTHSRSPRAAAISSVRKPNQRRLRLRTASTVPAASDANPPSPIRGRRNAASTPLSAATKATTGHERKWTPRKLVPGVCEIPGSPLSTTKQRETAAREPLLAWSGHSSSKPGPATAWPATTSAKAGVETHDRADGDSKEAPTGHGGSRSGDSRGTAGPGLLEAHRLARARLQEGRRLCGDTRAGASAAAADEFEAVIGIAMSAPSLVPLPVFGQDSLSETETAKDETARAAGKLLGDWIRACGNLAACRMAQRRFGEALDLCRAGVAVWGASSAARACSSGHEATGLGVEDLARLPRGLALRYVRACLAMGNVEEAATAAAVLPPLVAGSLAPGTSHIPDHEQSLESRETRLAMEESIHKTLAPERRVIDAVARAEEAVEALQRTSLPVPLTLAAAVARASTPSEAATALDTARRQAAETDAIELCGLLTEGVYGAASIAIRAVVEALSAVRDAESLVGCNACVAPAVTRLAQSLFCMGLSRPASRLLRSCLGPAADAVCATSAASSSSHASASGDDHDHDGDGRTGGARGSGSSVAVDSDRALVSIELCDAAMWLGRCLWANAWQSPGESRAAPTSTSSGGSSSVFSGTTPSAEVLAGRDAQSLFDTAARVAFAASNTPSALPHCSGDALLTTAALARPQWLDRLLTKAGWSSTPTGLAASDGGAFASAAPDSDMTRVGALLACQGTGLQGLIGLVGADSSSSRRTLWNGLQLRAVSLAASLKEERRCIEVARQQAEAASHPESVHHSGYGSKAGPAVLAGWAPAGSAWGEVVRVCMGAGNTVVAAGAAAECARWAHRLARHSLARARFHRATFGDTEGSSSGRPSSASEGEDAAKENAALLKQEALSWALSACALDPIRSQWRLLLGECFLRSGSTSKAQDAAVVSLAVASHALCLLDLKGTDTDSSMPIASVSMYTLPAQVLASASSALASLDPEQRSLAASALGLGGGGSGPLSSTRPERPPTAALGGMCAALRLIERVAEARCAADDEKRRQEVDAEKERQARRIKHQQRRQQEQAARERERVREAAREMHRAEKEAEARERRRAERRTPTGDTAPESPPPKAQYTHHQQHKGGDKDGGGGVDGATETLYRRLGVQQSVGTPEIRKAYRRLARKLHPDKILQRGGSGDTAEAAAERFKAVTAAYEVLSDRAQRTEYDRHLGATATPASTATPAAERAAAGYHWPAQQQREQQRQAAAASRGSAPGTGYARRAAWGHAAPAPAPARVHRRRHAPSKPEGAKTGFPFAF